MTLAKETGGGADSGGVPGRIAGPIFGRGLGAPKRVTLFVPCYVDRTRPTAGIAAVELLEQLGHTVEVRSSAYCCGQPFTNSGCSAEGQRSARHWYEQMTGAECVVVLSSSCTVQLRHLRPTAGGCSPRMRWPRSSACRAVSSRTASIISSASFTDSGGTRFGCAVAADDVAVAHVRTV